MTRKYNIAASTSLMNMSFSFTDSESLESYMVSAAVDFFNQKVHFLGEAIEGVDYASLEEDILSYLAPDRVDVPAMPDNMLRQIREAREGKRQGNLFRNKE